jgi:hypothetical protein
MTTANERQSVSKGMRPLPRPNLVATVLKVAALLAILVGVAAAVAIFSGQCTFFQFQAAQPAPFQAQAAQPAPLHKALLGLAMILGGVILAAFFYALALIAQYTYHAAMHIRLAERRQLLRETETDPAAAASGTQFNEQMVALLREINENTLLSDADKGRKRLRLAESRRELKIEEIRQFIAATKWPTARDRIEDFRAEYGDDAIIGTLLQQLDRAIEEHEQVDVMTQAEQIRSYMSLDLWDKARETARQLSVRYPNDLEAKKMLSTVADEEKSHQREECLRLYREIEQLVKRKHYRESKKLVETLIQQYPGSPEAATLKGQMDELTRNADIEVRREMEAQIIEHTRQNRHREAYEVARLLVEQYPESPQALALKDQLDKLRERAGLSS